MQMNAFMQEAEGGVQAETKNGRADKFWSCYSMQVCGSLLGVWMASQNTTMRIHKERIAHAVRVVLESD